MRVEFRQFMDTEPTFIEPASPALWTRYRVLRLKLRAWIHQQLGWRDTQGRKVKWDWEGSLEFSFWVQTGVSVSTHCEAIRLVDLLVGRKGARGEKLENWLTAYLIAAERV